MTFFLRGIDTEQAATVGAPLPDAPTTAGEAFRASSYMEKVRTDWWSLRERVAGGVEHEIRSALGKTDRGPADVPINDGSEIFPMASITEHPRGRLATYYPDNELPPWEQVAALKQASADLDGNMRAELDFLPASRAEFDAEVNRRLEAELEDAIKTIGLRPEGSWAAELSGGLWTGLSDPASVVTAPVGLASGASLARIALMGLALGVTGEGLTLPRQYEMAALLDLLPKPEPLKQMGIAGVVGAVLSTALPGAFRFGGYLRERRAAVRRHRPDDTNAFEFDARIEEATRALGADGRDMPARPPAFGDFDFSPSGNASPRTNRAGYVFGKLLERGYEPHIASGIVGNLMQESTVALHPQIRGDGGAAGGIAQWNGPRFAALKEYARTRGKDWRDLDLQIDFLDFELKGPERANWEKIRQARTAREAALLFSRHFERPGEPHNGRRIAYAEDLAQQFQSGEVPRWKRALPAAAEDVPTFATSRGYTGRGQVLAGDDIRLDVGYEVVDASILRQASGDLQPRDRARAASDAWVAATAARLEPGLLMPSPSADRGAPLVGPDNVIESGNGRVRVIQRAYERHPDRAAAYRGAIEELTGKPIPEGVKQPVLIARRKTELSGADRRRLVVDAQDSGVARMNATERAQVGTRALSADLMAKYRPGFKFTSPENRAFARDFAASFPRSERNAFFAADGSLSIDGRRQLQDSLFARAWEAPDFIARRVEVAEGDLRSLMQALDDAAPEWAMLRSEIEAGRVRPEMDISPFVLDAMRLITAAREQAARQGGDAAGSLDEILAQGGLFEDAFSPLTVALVRKFMPGGRQAPADKIAAFLRKYVDEAMKAGRVGDGVSKIGPADVLRAIDRKTFGDLPDDLGQPRPVDLRAERDAPLAEGAFSEGARSPEVVAADEAAIEELRPSRGTHEILARVEPDEYVQELALAQPFDDLDTLYRLAARAQADMVPVVRDAARKVGGRFSDPGLKSRSDAESKIGRKKYDTPRRLTDISRVGVTVRNVEDADALVREIGSSFDLVDEGWSRSPVAYTDRKIVIRHDNGMLSEVQIWTPEMKKAKDAGTKLYNERRALPENDPKAIRLRQEENAIYSAAMDLDFPSGVSGSSKSPNLVLKDVRNSSSDRNVLAVSNTSSASTAAQSAPGASRASAESFPSPSNRTAGRRSQSQKNTRAMESPPLVGDTSNIGTATADVNTLRADFGDIELDLPDGTKLRGSDLLDDIEADQDLADIINLCGGPG